MKLKIIKLPPLKTSKVERSWESSITCIRRHDGSMQYNLRHYRFKHTEDGWLVVERLKTPRK